MLPSWASPAPRYPTQDHDTRLIFGEYIDIYDLTQAVEDGATVRVYYEARLVRVELPEDVRTELDADFDAATELAEIEDTERLKSRWARVEAIVGADKRIAQVAADIVAALGAPPAKLRWQRA